MKKIFQFSVVFLFVLSSMCALSQQQNQQQKDSNTNSEVIKVIEPQPCCCDTPSTKVCNEYGVPVQDILLDFKTKALSLPKDAGKITFEKGTAFRVRVMNYNPLLYKVVINKTDSSATVPLSGSMLTTLLEPSGLLGMVTGILANVNTVPVVPTLGEQTSFLELFKMKRETPKAFRQRIETEIDTVERTQGDAVLAIRQLSSDISNLRNEINAILFAYARRLAETSAIAPDCNLLQQLGSKASIQQMIDSLQGHLSRVSEKRTEIATESFNYLLKISKHRTLVAATKQLHTTDSLLNAAFSLLQQEVGKIEAAFSHKTIEELARRYDLLSQFSTCYTSLPIFMKKDISDFTIELNPRFDSTGLPPYKTSFFLPWRQKRIWGLSAGVYLNNLKSDLYAVRRDSSAAGVQYNLVKEDESSNVEIGANALAYTSWSISSTKPNYLGLSFGAGLSIESKPKPRLFFGVSFISGERNRLVFSAGFVGGYVSRLSSAYSSLGPYTTEPTGFVRDVVKPGAFFSINYSFL